MTSPRRASGVPRSAERVRGKCARGHVFEALVRLQPEPPGGGLPCDERCPACGVPLERLPLEAGWTAAACDVYTPQAGEYARSQRHATDEERAHLGVVFDNGRRAREHGEGRAAPRGLSHVQAAAWLAGWDHANGSRLDRRQKPRLYDR